MKTNDSKYEIRVSNIKIPFLRVGLANLILLFIIFSILFTIKIIQSIYNQLMIQHYCLLFLIIAIIIYLSLNYYFKYISHFIVTNKKIIAIGPIKKHNIFNEQIEYLTIKNNPFIGIVIGVKQKGHKFVNKFIILDYFIKNEDFNIIPKLKKVLSESGINIK